MTSFGMTLVLFCCRHRKMWRNELFLWSVQNGWRSDFLMNLYIEKYWETPLDELRGRLSITPPPCNVQD